LDRDPALGDVMAEEERIRAFWDWWDDRQDPPTPDEEDLLEISEAVHAIHPQLQWEIGPGRHRPHSLVVSGAGDAVLRMLAERWKLAAPASEAYEFHTTRQPLDRDQLEAVTLQFGQDDYLAVSQCLVAVEVDDTTRQIDLQLYHPMFSALPEQAVQQIVFILISNALGEDAVERWVGGMGPLTEPPVDGLSLVQLSQMVEGLPDRWPKERAWVVASATMQDGQKLLFKLDLGIKRWDFPFFDTWCAVDMAVDEEDFEEAQELGNALVETLGPDAACVGTVLGGGFRSVMLYMLPQTVERVRAWAGRQSRPVEVSSEPDPEWKRRPRL
jgi:hypothetical protein